MATTNYEELKGYTNVEQQNRYLLLLRAVDAVMSADRQALNGQMISIESFIQLKAEVALSITELDFRRIEKAWFGETPNQVLIRDIREKLSLLPVVTSPAEI